MTMASDSDPTVAPGDSTVAEPAVDLPAAGAAPAPQAPPASAPTPPPDAAPSSPPSDGEPPAEEPEPQRESLIDAVADLLQMAVNWLRAEAADLVKDQKQFIALNAELSKVWPVITDAKPHPADADDWKDVKDKLVLPIQQLGLTLASASAAGCLLVIGLGFIFVAILMVLAHWLTWPGALALVGGLIVLGAAIFTAIKMRSIQK